MKLESETGKGTIVRLVLPRADGMPVSTAAGDAPSPQRPIGTALLVEDDPDVLQFAAAVFKDFGYEVMTAADGAAAVRLIESGKPIDLLFTDVVMPHGISGIELPGSRASAGRRCACS